LYWIEGKKLMRYDISQKEKIEVGELPSEFYLYLQIGQQIVTLIKKDTLETYTLPQELNP
ncbi:MAG: hypothetical protein LPK25_17500, partial [Cyclobacteriaceae bacterium]|nr:hypothetical protein [Cyclobacteriaceae bacterium]